MKIPFGKTYLTGHEEGYLSKALASGMLQGDGEFTRLCSERIEALTGAHKTLLTHSCTAALEMAALLGNIGLGDEVVMPSYTFVSTANAFVLRGAVPVFVDIRSDTQNLDETLIEAAITSRTKAIVPVHYAGVACEMNAIMEIARRHKLLVIEDAAQGVMARYQNRPLGTIGEIGTFSFHVTKNIVCGEGGALLLNDPSLVRDAEIIREKGTNRSELLKGVVDKYTWIHPGSSYLPSELNAATLLGQLDGAEEITSARLDIWNTYHALLKPLEDKGLLTRAFIPQGIEHNAHIYYLLLGEQFDRTDVLSRMAGEGVQCTFHYVPLHSSPAGEKYGRVSGELTRTENASSYLIRLPMWVGLTKDELHFVVDRLESVLTS